MQKSDQNRFDTLVAPHLEALYRFAFRLVRNVPDAQDLVQDTCETALGSIASLTAADSPRRWLLRVQHNRFVDGYRRRGRSPETSLPETDDLECLASELPDPEQLVQQAQSEELLQRAFLQLEEVPRTLLALRAEGYDLPEIEAITGVERSVLSRRLHRARVRLTHLMSELNLDAANSRQNGSAR
jgi:RNA polymerase sigma-70 factor (ECF subfamily)